MGYRDDDYLMISGIQHFCFCRRQWALIHIEQQWQENLLTVEGEIAHEHCHNENFLEKRGNLLITRGMRVSSHVLGATGQCDVVEFIQDERGALLYGYSGRWMPYPIEYKRGKSKLIDADRLQLCAQAIALEEMLKVEIKAGALYYKETNRREEVEFSNELRSSVFSMFEEMHNYYRKGYTPLVKPQRGCSSCSLAEICMPVICKHTNVDKYYHEYLEEET